jgi:hypothetical protein
MTGRGVFWIVALAACIAFWWWVIASVVAAVERVMA